jgi:hypothetical protein
VWSTLNVNGDNIAADIMFWSVQMIVQHLDMLFQQEVLLCVQFANIENFPRIRAPHYHVSINSHTSDVPRERKEELLVETAYPGVGQSSVRTRT